ncbi:hypothetical protein RugamoR64_21890 [Duganella rhizosphaerae]|uniref:uracil-DNA glycosylase n=1 Tax=Duganella rhizosphaerae TaxID=2885763 RepID=UPI0030E7FF40
MSQTISRSTVFLDEMGVGVQWKLRNPPVGEQAVVEDDVAGEPVAALAEAPPAPAAVAAPAPAPVAAVAAAAAAVVPAPAPAPLVAEPPAAEEAPAMAGEDSTAWFDEAPAPARAAPVSDADIAAMDWPALNTAVSTCTRCALCDTRRNAVNGRGAADATWIAIAAAPSRLDEKENQAVAGEAGQLLDNMLKAIALKPEADVYVTNLVKCRPSGPDGADRAPSGEELLACRPFLERELALTGATMAMTFGQYAAKGLMMGPAARGQVMRYGAAQLPVVATYHPDDLLRKPEDKAKAWGDLCLAKAARD